MRLLADENVEASVIRGLRDAGFDVLAIGEHRPRSTDPSVLELVRAEQRILVTNDKDFAELVFFQGKASAGIILIRMPRSSSRRKLSSLVDMLRLHSEGVPSSFTVIYGEIRPAPHAAPAGLRQLVRVGVPVRGEGLHDHRERRCVGEATTCPLVPRRLRGDRCARRGADGGAGSSIRRRRGRADSKSRSFQALRSPCARRRWYPSKALRAGSAARQSL